MPFAELSATSNFTFLTGASHPEDYAERAAFAGHVALAIADENTVAGIVRAHTRLKEIARIVAERAAQEAREGEIGPPRPDHAPRAPGPDIRNVPALLPAARLRLADGFSATALPRDRAAWGRLCRLITLGRRRAEKGACLLRFDDLLEWGEGMELILHPPGRESPPHLRAGPDPETWRRLARRLARRFPGACHMALAPCYDGRDAARFDRLAACAADLGLPTVATAAPRMHHGRQRDRKSAG